MWHRESVQTTGAPAHEVPLLCSPGRPFQVPSSVEGEPPIDRGQAEAPSCVLDEPVAYQAGEV